MGPNKVCTALVVCVYLYVHISTKAPKSFLKEICQNVTPAPFQQLERQLDSQTERETSKKKCLSLDLIFCMRAAFLRCSAPESSGIDCV